MVRGAPFHQADPRSRSGLHDRGARGRAAHITFDRHRGLAQARPARRATRTADVEVVDLGSRNGTFVNGQRVEQAPLRDGDEIRFGQAVVRLRYVGRVGPKGTADAAPPPRPPDLSAREYEVACLVADGLTNADVGKRLSISPATVGRHLSNIYERLGIHSRAALARYVTDPKAGRGSL